MAKKLLIIILIFLPFVMAAQTPSPCPPWQTYGPNEIPFAYDANLCRPQIIGFFELIKGKRASCTINVCSEVDEQIELYMVNPPPDMTIDDNWHLVWQPSPNDVGIHYIHFRAATSEIAEATIIYNVKHDRRPKFDLIRDKQIAGKKQYYADLVRDWLYE